MRHFFQRESGNCFNYKIKGFVQISLKVAESSFVDNCWLTVAVIGFGDCVKRHLKSPHCGHILNIDHSCGLHKILRDCARTRMLQYAHRFVSHFNYSGYHKILSNPLKLHKVVLWLFFLQLVAFQNLLPAYCMLFPGQCSIRQKFLNTFGRRSSHFQSRSRIVLSAPAETLIPLDITKTCSNHCFIIYCIVQKKEKRQTLLLLITHCGRLTFTLGRCIRSKITN